MPQKLFRFDFPTAQVMTFIALAHSEEEARSLISAAVAGDHVAKRQVEFPQPAVLFHPSAERVRSAPLGGDEEKRLRALKVVPVNSIINMEFVGDVD